MVPFRLTQNVVDGFGVTGVEGLYRRCAETTLQAGTRSQQAQPPLQHHDHVRPQPPACAAALLRRFSGSTATRS